MKNRLRLLVVLLIIALVGTGTVLLTRNFLAQRRADLTRQVLDLLPQVAQRIQDFHRVKVEDGRKIWEVSAREAQYYDGPEPVVVVDEPLVYFFMKDGRSIGLRGHEGKVMLVNTELTAVELEGDINADFAGYAMRTEAARYERSADAVTALGSIQITGSQFDLHGEGLTLQVSEQRLMVHNNVHMTIYPGA